MSKHKNHVDRRRNLIGNALGEQRIKEMERCNRTSPVYSVSSSTGQKFEVYNPNANKGRRGRDEILYT
ncbi:MAG: hypothetical protein JL50_05525 [Peptococcaceae bacterium BICA1-7]|nr:MAG: hypothetical protein JL50_05525 [Peptococcaceae bacterium BICA1-7]HBV96071.1 hypothetical protein [Desulfotomaculum sp.]